MKLDFIAEKKNSITVSGLNAGTTANLQTVHTVKNAIVWASPNSTFSWIKLNVYEVEVIDQIVMQWTGDLTSMKIERSIDDFNWEILSDITNAQLPPDRQLDIDYTSQNVRDAKFIRVTITGPGVPSDPFKLTIFQVFGQRVFVNTDIISHNIFNLYSEKEIEEFPLFPDIQKQIFRMLEGNNDLNLKLFDESLFANSNISKNVMGDTVTFIPNNIPVISGTLYIWDFDDPTALITNPNIIVTENPLINQVHTYNNAGFYVIRLLVDNKKLILEFTDSHTKA